MNPVQRVFSFEFVLAPHGTGFVWYSAKKKKRALVRLCHVLFIPQYCSVSLGTADKQIDHS